MESLKDNLNDFKEMPAGGVDKAKSVESSNEPASSEESDEPVSKRIKIIEYVKDEVNEHITTSSADDSQQDDLVTLSVGLRRFKRIPIFIVDYHNDVLAFVYRCFASRHLPLENNTLLHFDSHPDMVTSRELLASCVFDKETMLAELSIDNWIMQACYAGHFNRVIWMKNSWCNQNPVGKFNFKVGHKDDKISADCCLDYFVSEGIHCQSSDLKEARN